MTREEAIQILKRLLPVNHIDDVCKAIDMAIEALHREEAEAKGYAHRIRPKEYQPLQEVVLCKDCIHRIDRRSDLGHFMCEMFYGQGDVSDENFCQWGERKEL